jgi:preprotein translocase subunit SecG
MQVIMIARLHAMYQRSRKMLIFLVVFFLAVTITSGIITVIQSSHFWDGKLRWCHEELQRVRLTRQITEEVVLFGTYQCNDEGHSFLLSAITWILGTVWETLALYLAVRIAIKHFRERLSTGSMIEECFTVLIKSHVFYFARWACCLSDLSFERWSYVPFRAF